MTILLLLSAIAIASQAPMAIPPVAIGQKDGVPFKGGPYAGLSVGTVTTPDGKTFRGLLPSQPGSSPVSAKYDLAIKAFVAGHANPSAEPLSAHLKKNAKFIFCKQQGAPCQVSRVTPLTFAEPVQANAPFALRGGKVRIEWIFGTGLYYITELTLKDGKIAVVQTQPAWPPLEPRKSG